MASIASGGDFACCGHMYEYCVQLKGCGYCGGGVDNLIHASQHCTVFSKLYVEKDPEYIRKWTNQNRGQVMRQSRKTRPVVNQSENKSLEALLAQAQALVKQYGGVK